MRRRLYSVDGSSAVDGGSADGSLGVRVLLAEAHTSLRRVLSEVLSADYHVRLVGEATDLEGAVQLARLRRPGVIVVDLGLFDGGVTGITELQRLLPDVGIVVLTMRPTVELARRALGAEALGFVLKDSADVELLDAVRSAAAGAPYTSPRVAPADQPSQRRSDGATE